MKYFLDTEFLEGPQNKEIFGFTIGKTKPTIDFISIGLVAEDGREYYAISKDFNLKEAWNRYDEVKLDNPLPGITHKRVYWIRENVLKPIFEYLMHLEGNRVLLGKPAITNRTFKKDFCYETFEYLLKSHGKTNKLISYEILEFVYPLEQWKLLHKGSYIDDNKYLVMGIGTYATVEELLQYSVPQIESPEFYTYYGSYDWVVFCWLFGKMIDLPKGFPMYSRDLKQILDEKAEKYTLSKLKSPIVSSDWHSNYCIDGLKRHPDYPKQENEHNALSDARWNKKLYEFLKNI